MRMLPGFTAAAGLRPPLQHYATEMSPAGGSAHRPRSEALPNGGGCRPSCGPCTSSLSFPSGCSEICTTASCDSIERPCTCLLYTSDAADE